MSSDNGSGEEPTAGLSRLQLIRRAGSLGAAAAIPGVAGATAPDAPAAETDAAVAADDDSLRALTAAEAITLEAFLERLLPSDVAGPGAKEAKVIRYIDWSLAGDLSAFHAPYSAALVAIDAFAVQTFGAAFAALTAVQQDALITRMAAGAEKPITSSQDPQQGFTGFAPTSTSVFTMIRTHALQGMFGDPMHGGNVGQVGWKLVRFPGPRLLISKKDQDLDVTPKEYLKSTYTYSLFKNTTRRP
jgi:gluconate 2-dehydrogenase gamma chain